MRRFSVGLAVTVILLAAFATGPMSSAASPSRSGALAQSARMTGLPLLQRQVLAAINDFRRRQGLLPLRLNAALGAAAYEHSLSMADHGFFAHESYGGSPFWKRVAAKYAGGGAGWKVGENLVWRSPWLSARAALELWLASPAHRDVLLSPSWREIGLGAIHASSAPGIYAGQAVTILTADFGVRS
jgi:uncharacterized protein YkwD